MTDLSTATNSAISSAEQLRTDRKARFDAAAPVWAPDSWRLYREVGEYNAAVGWIANGLGQIRFAPEVWDGGAWVEDKDERAWAVMQSLGDQQEMMTNWGKNSVVGGEAMLALSGGRWTLRSRSEIAFTDRQVRLNEYGTGAGSRRRTADPTGPTVSDLWRIWLPDAQFSKMPWTPVASYLADLEQLRLLRLVLNAKLNTRLWLNGVWVMSQALSLPTQTSEGTPGRGPSFLNQLKVLFETNIKRRNTAKDVTPILIQTTTPEVGKVIETFYPETTIDEREAALRAEIRHTLRELLDLPIEMQTGLGDTNHFASWSIPDVNKIYSLEPRANSLLNAISFSWYTAQLRSVGMSPGEAGARRLALNSTALRGDPSSDEVRQAWDRGTASDQAVRSATRIPDTAKPDDDEYVRIVGRRTNEPYLALWGLDVHKEIDWSMVGTKKGAPGSGIADPQRAPGVGDPGSPTDPNSEVGKG